MLRLGGDDRLVDPDRPVGVAPSRRGAARSRPGRRRHRGWRRRAPETARARRHTTRRGRVVPPGRGHRRRAARLWLEARRRSPGTRPSTSASIPPQLAGRRCDRSSGTPSGFIKYRSPAPQPFGWGPRPIRVAAAILQRFTRICRGRRPRSAFSGARAPDTRRPAPDPAIRGERYEQVENRRGRRGCRRGRGRGCGPCPPRPWPDPGRARARAARARSPDRWEPDWRVDPRRRGRRREEPERRECRRPRGGGLDRQPR